MTRLIATQFCPLYTINRLKRILDTLYQENCLTRGGYFFARVFHFSLLFSIKKYPVFSNVETLTSLFLFFPLLSLVEYDFPPCHPRITRTMSMLTPVHVSPTFSSRPHFSKFVSRKKSVATHRSPSFVFRFAWPVEKKEVILKTPQEEEKRSILLLRKNRAGLRRSVGPSKRERGYQYSFVRPKFGPSC